MLQVVNEFLLAINEFFRQYPAVSTLLTSGISALIGVAIGWKIHRWRIDHDALVEHFKEIKSHVINPLLHGIKSQSYHFPPMRAIFDDESVSTISRYYSVDIDLCRDFLANHYPQIKAIWDRIARISDDIDATDHRLTRFIDQRILADCLTLGIEHRKNRRDASHGTHGVPLDDFSDALKNLILSDSYNEADIYLPDDSQNWILITTSVNRSLYYSENEDRILQVQQQLRNISNNINEDVADDIANYQRMNHELDQSLMGLQRMLNIILHKTNLPLQKEFFFKIKCQFIKSSLD